MMWLAGQVMVLSGFWKLLIVLIAGPWKAQSYDLREETQIYVYDINLNMLNVGKKRAQERGLGDLGSLVWVEGDAEKLTFKGDSMDGYTIAFGIRNVTHIEKVLAEAYRVLKKGVRFLCFELNHVDTLVFKQL